ncbi:MAG: methyltransferase domain-containing protein [Acidobacteriota bacterium]
MERENTEKIYTHYAGIYDLLFDRVFDPGRRLAVESLEVTLQDRVLIVGIGTGLSLGYFPREALLTGIDISEAMLTEAGEKTSEMGFRNLELVRMDASRMLFPDDTFDKVYLPHMLSTVRSPERVLSEVVRVSKPGARIAILNHLRSRNRFIGFWERVLSPVTARIGFRLDLPVATVASQPGLGIQSIQKVNFLRLWHLLVCQNQQDSSTS